MYTHPAKLNGITWAESRPSHSVPLFTTLLDCKKAAARLKQQNDLCAWWRLRSESSLFALWVAKDPRFLHVDSEDPGQTGRMPRLIWVFTGRTGHFVGFVLLMEEKAGSCHHSEIWIFLASVPMHSSCYCALPIQLSLNNAIDSW